MKRGIAALIFLLSVFWCGQSFAEVVDSARAAAAQAVSAASEEVVVLQARQPESSVLRIAGLPELRGHLARIDCRKQDAVVSMPWGRALAYLEERDEEYLRVHTGNLLFPELLGRFQMGSEEGRQSIATLLERAQLASMVPGNLELAAPRAEYSGLVEKLIAAQIPMQAANLVCTPEGGHEAFCELLGTDRQGTPWKIYEQGDLRVAFVAAVDPTMVRFVSQENLAGLDLQDPVIVLERVLTRLRATENVDVVALLYHLPVSDPRTLDRIASTLEVDLLLANELLSTVEEGERGYVVAAGTGTMIVNIAARADSLVLMEATFDHQSGRISSLRVQAQSTRDAVADEEHRALVQSEATRLCAQWGQAVGDVALHGPWSLEDFQTWTLEVLRATARAEVAFFNRGAFRSVERFPVDELTHVDILGTLPFDDVLIRARMKGSDLKALVGRANLLQRGLSQVSGDVLVNARPLVDTREYTVVLNRFVADGGDGLVNPATLIRPQVFRQKERGTSSITEHLIEWVTSDRWRLHGPEDAVLHPWRNAADQAKRFYWQILTNALVAYNAVHIVNPQRQGAGAYTQNQLTLSPTDQLSMEGRARVLTENRNQGFDNQLVLQYAMTRLVEDEDSEFEPTRDLIRFSSAWKWLRPRTVLQNRWYAPIPFIEGELESEFQVPEEREFRRMQGTGILGVMFRIWEPLELRIGANIRRELLDPAGAVTVGSLLGWNLRRTDLVNLLGRSVQGESSLDWFFNDITRSNIHEIRSSNRVNIALFQRLYLSATLAIFAYRSEEVGEFGLNREITFGLNYQWDTAFQRIP